MRQKTERERGSAMGNKRKWVERIRERRGEGRKREREKRREEEDMTAGKHFCLSNPKKKKSVVFIIGSQTMIHSGQLGYENVAQDLVPYFSKVFFFSYCIIS